MLINLPPRGSQLNKAHPISRDLVAYFPLNENGGNRACDLSGNDNLGTIDGPDWTAEGLKFAGSQAEEVNCGDKRCLQLTGGTGITMAGWVRLDDVTVNHTLLIVDYGYYLRIRSANSKFDAGLYDGASWGGGVNFAYSDFAIKTWFHVAFTWSDRSKEAKCYVDGLQIATTGTLNQTLGVKAAFDLLVGRVTWSGYALKGLLKGVGLWRRPLLGVEVAMLHRQPDCMFEQQARAGPYSGAAIVTYPRSRAGFKPIRGADRLRGLRHIA